MVKPGILFGNFGRIITLALFVILVKTICDFVIAALIGLRGKTAIAIGLGLSQVGEFSFVIFSLAISLKLLTIEDASVVIGSVLLTLILTPFLFKSIVPVWRWLKGKTSNYPWLYKYFVGTGEPKTETSEYQNHIIICGYGRVGGWVGRALSEIGAPFVIVDYNQAVVADLKKKDYPVIYGDPGEPEVLEAAGIRQARAVVLAIPDRISQEMVVGYVQTVASQVKIISRVHLDEDWERLKLLKVDKIIQPEFEAAVAVTKTILTSMGKSREEINDRIKKLRISRSLK